MANMIVDLGQQTTNLLSNDNLIVYSDISMTSKFNPIAVTLDINSKPNEENYYLNLNTETRCGISNGISSTGSIDIQIFSTSEDISANNSNVLVIFPNNNYFNDMFNYYDNANTSKFTVEKNINVKAIQQSIHNIFTWMPGERILNPEFGNTLHRLLYNGITEYNQEQIVAEIRRCISEYEPRVEFVEIRNVSTIDDIENNTIHLEIVYTIPTLNEKQYAYSYIYHKSEY